MKSAPKNLQKSFTLIEILIIIAILAILASIVVVTVNPTKRTNQAKVVTALRFAKQIDYSLAFETAADWSFNDPSNPAQAPDDSGNNSHGTIYGATYDCNDTPFHVVGQTAQQCSLNFDGVDDRVDLPNNGGTVFPNDKFTVSFWAKPSDTSLSTNFWEYGRDGGSGRVLAGHSGTKWRIISYLNQNRLEGGTATVGEWSHIVFIKNGTTDKLYIDGKQVAQGDLNPQINAGEGSLIHRIGRGFGIESGYFPGKIDEMSFYREVLTSTQIQRLYAQELPSREPNSQTSLTSRKLHLLPL